MKKIALFLLVLLLVGCSSGVPNPDLPEASDIPEVSKSPETTCDPCTVVADEKVEEKNYIDLLGFNPNLADNVVHRAGRKGMGIEVDESTYQTVLTNNLYLAIRNGRLSITNIETGEYFEYQNPTDFKALAEYVDCGTIYAYALTDSGNVYEIEVENMQYLSEFTPEDILDGLTPLNLNMKISALAVKDYKWIHSTCGTFGVYVVDSKGVERSINRKFDESGTTYSVGEPTYKTKYVDYICMDKEEAIGTPESPVKYLLLMLDGTVRVGHDYDGEDVRIDNAGLKNSKGITISASEIIKAENEEGTVKVYIISEDSVLYSYSNDTVFEEGRCAAVINQSNGNYPYPVQIVLETGEVIDIPVQQ